MKRAGRWMARLAVAVLLTTVLVPNRSAAQTVTVGVGGELSAPLFQNFLVPIYVDMTGVAGEKLGSYKIRVSWDPNALSYNGFEEGAFGEPITRTDSIFAGVLWITGVSPSGLDGVFDLIQLEMDLFTSAGSPVDLQVFELYGIGPTFNDLTSVATLTVINGVACEARGRWGDLDNDGLANSRDALAILSEVVGLPVDSLVFDVTLGDVDGDAAVNTRDALILLSYGVGLDITGQRVLLTAGGACSANLTPNLQFFPDSIDLVPGQRVRVIPQATDASGALVAIPPPFWEVADPAVAVVSDEGQVVGRAVGVTTLTVSLGPGVESTVPVVVRQTRGTWYVDAARAWPCVSGFQNSGLCDNTTFDPLPVQLGTIEFPYATPEYAFPIAAEGDTIRVAPGTHDYVGTFVSLEVGVHVVGDTLNDGTRPVLRSPQENNFLAAFEWEDGGTAAIENLDFRGFYEMADITGLRNLTVRNVAWERPETISSGYGVYVNTRMDTLTVLGTEFLGDSSFSLPIYVSAGASLVRVEDTRFVFNDDAIYGFDVDSLDVRRSEFLGVTGWPIYADVGFDTEVQSTAATLIQNRVLDPDLPVGIFEARSAFLHGNFVRMSGDDAFNIWHSSALPGDIGTKVTAIGDTILVNITSGFDTYDVQSFDSVVVDSTHVEYVTDLPSFAGGFLDGNTVSVTNSSFLGARDFPLSITGRDVTVDNSVFTGCPTCDWSTGTGLWVDARSLGEPVSLTLTNSSFFKFNVAVDGNQTSGDSAGPWIITGNTVDSVTTGFDVVADSVTISDNTISSVRLTGINAVPTFSGRFWNSVIQRNTVSCVPTTSRGDGIDFDNQPGLITDNTITDCDYGITATNSSANPIADLTIARNDIFMDTAGTGVRGVELFTNWRTVFRGNRMRRGQYGLYLQLGSSGDVTVVDSNAVSEATTAGMRFVSSNFDISGVRNNVSNNQVGMDVGGAGTRSFRLGSFVGNIGLAISTSLAVVADNNWWGDAAGPAVGGPNGVSASVDASSPLATAPTDVPTLTPPPPGFSLFSSRALGDLESGGNAENLSLEDQDGLTPAEREVLKKRRARTEERRLERMAARQESVERRRLAEKRQTERKSAILKGRDD